MERQPPSRLQAVRHAELPRQGGTAAQSVAPKGMRTAFPDLPVAAGMAFLAGGTDVYGLNRLHDLYVSFMSGNTTSLGMALGRSDWARGELIAELVGLFVAGAAAGAALGVAGGRRHAAVVAFVVTVFLSVPLLQPGWTIPSLVLAMGALNAAMSRIGETAVSLTYVTGTLVKFGQGLGRTVCGQPGDWTWLLQLPMWLSLLAGAMAAVLVQQHLGEGMLWPLPGLALLLAFGTLAHERA